MIDAHLEECRRKVNEMIKKINDETGFTEQREVWEQRQGETAEERLQDWVRRVDALKNQEPPP